jgi:hypothetical protein
MSPRLDDEMLLERLYRRLAAIERDVPDPPPLDAGRLARPSGGPLLRWVASSAAVVVLAVMIGLLVLGAPRVASPGAAPVATPTPPPAESMVTVDRATLSDDRRSIRLEFVGGAPHSPFDPCSNAYDGWVRVAGDQLEVAAYEVEAFRLRIGEPACLLIGYSRELVVELAGPFAGHLARDLHSGNMLHIDMPDNLAPFRAPAGWRLHSEGDFSGRSATWHRTYVPADTPQGIDLGSSGLPGRLDLYHAFDATADVYVEGDRSTVTVNRSPAALYHRADTGALAVVWSVGSDGFALVGSEDDFSIAELIALAETVGQPDP